MNINDPAPTKAFALPFTRAGNTNATFEHHEMRMPFAHKIPDKYRNHFIAMCGEFVGTVLFLYFALSGAQVANSVNSSAGLTVEETGSNPQQLQYISLSFGFSLAVNAWVFFRISGGLFNPAVTVGMCLIGALPWIRGGLLIVSQVLGGIVASAMVSCMFPGPLDVDTTLGGGTSIVRGLFIEMMLTAELVFAIFMLAAEKHKGTFIAPVGIGLALFVAEMSGVYFTGGSLNPARSFGPSVVNASFVGYHWIYWVGPLLGAVVAAGFYKFIKVLEYETANPGQDSQGAETVILKPASQGGDSEAATLQHLGGSNGNFQSMEMVDRRIGSQDFSSGYNRPAMTGRAPSNRPRVESPGMAAANDAYTGLAHGMHGDERPIAPRSNSRIV